MKITGPGSGVPTEAPGGAPDVAGPAKKGFAQAVEKGAATEAAAQPAAADRAQIVADVSADLRAGRITPDKALDRVVDRILDRQLGADAPPAMREKMGAVLREALASDPLLIEKVRSLASGG